MPDDILNSMRALREDMRQRLLQSPEYRALEALDGAIDEIGAILQDTLPVSAQPPVPQEAPDAVAPAPAAEAPQPPAARHNAIAAAFAETLAAKLDHRNGARVATPYQPTRRVHFE